MTGGPATWSWPPASWRGRRGLGWRRLERKGRGNGRHPRPRLRRHPRSNPRHHHAHAGPGGPAVRNRGDGAHRRIAAGAAGRVGHPADHPAGRGRVHFPSPGRSAEDLCRPPL
ncbi:hypothetical protein AZA_90571 [Nitrospirillum viridazoti Y2]|nr:hypothetical protein AZA_90571 [Nitrospirillum amazonense Y2]